MYVLLFVSAALARSWACPNLSFAVCHRIEANERAQLKDPKRVLKDLKLGVPSIWPNDHIQALSWRRWPRWGREEGDLGCRETVKMDTEDEMPIEDEKGNGGSIPVSILNIEIY
ncbi:hypothetical protein Tco_0871163 [Tanacetum coccineum]